MIKNLSLDLVKQHLGIDADEFEFDTYLQEHIIPAATEFVKVYIDNPEIDFDEEIPHNLLNGVLVVIADMFDVNRSSYSIQGSYNPDVLRRLLLPYKVLYGNASIQN